MNEIGFKKEGLDTPVLWVELDILERNIAALTAMFQTAGVGWRPHTKGIKVPEIAHKLIAAGALGVTCAKLGEAEVMAAAGIDDILIANQIVGPLKTARLARLAGRCNVIVAVDHPHNVAELGAAAVTHDNEIGVVIEVDTGMQRAGVPPGEATVELAKQVVATEGLTFKGLMAWEGHATRLAGEEKQIAVETAVGLLVETVALCRQAGLAVEIVSGGGSGTYLISPHLAGLTEIQAGGAIFNDVAYGKMGVQTEPAIFVQTQVTSRPAPDRILVDAGFKALPSWASEPRPIGIDDVERFSSSAEHGTLRLSRPNNEIEIGHRIDFMPGYTDATLFLHDRLYGMRNGMVEVVWEIAGRGKLR